MKQKLFITSILLAANILNIGCVSSVSSTYNNVKRSLNTSKENVDPLYGQVPEEDRGRVKQLENELAVTKQVHLISKLEERKSDLLSDRSENEEKRLYYLQQEQKMRIRLARIEAIDRNQLGDKIDNLESITDIHVDAIQIQQKRLKYEGAVAVLDVKIEQLELDISKEQNKLKQMTSENINSEIAGS